MLDTQKEQADLQNFFNDLPQKKQNKIAIC